MFKKTVSLLLCLLMIFTLSFSLCSCKDEKSDEYPVTVGNITIEEEPKNIVVLSDCLADVISYIGYDVKMVGRNVESDQEFLSVVPTVGTAVEPDVDAIVSYETDLVIAENTLSDNAKNKLSEAGIQVLTLNKATSLKELESLYVNLGTALGGNVTGKEQGKASYDELMKTISDFKDAIPNDIVKSACYLYLDEAGQLCTLTKNTIEYEIFSYNGAVNIFSSADTSAVDLELLRMSTPTYVFCDNEAVLDYLNSNAELSTMGALKNGNTYMIKRSDFKRQGTTYEEMVYHMIEFMFVTTEETPDEATPEEVETTSESTAETSAETPSETIVGFVE